MKRILLAVLLALTGCGGSSSAPVPPPSPSPAVTIPDVTAYLAMSRCTADGTPAVLESGCAAAPQRASDPMLFRPHDWSGHTDGQVSDAFVSDDGRYYVQSFSYPPHGPFVAAHGDGGDVLVSDGTTVRIDYTQNGTGGGTGAGYWGGAGCFLGAGWVEFDNEAPTGSWKSEVAYLNSTSTPNTCPSNLNAAYTRWRQETIGVPFYFQGNRSVVSLPSIITEHYNASSIGSATAMERVIMARGFGRVLWQAWSTTGPNVSLADPVELHPWSQAPAAGWYLQDERILTAIEPGGSDMTGNAYGWPGAGFVP